MQNIKQVHYSSMYY